MRIKKMLAVLAAISMLVSMGISAAAEDETAATTTVTTAEEAVTTAATEATTLTETEITTTAETTNESETETTVATEENAAAGEISEDGTIVCGTKTYQMGENGDGTPDFHEVKVVLYSDITEDWDETERLSVYVDGTLSNLAGIAVGSAIAGDPESQEYVCNPDNFFAISGVDEITITAYGIATSYYYYHSSGQFVKVGEMPDEPDTPDETVTEEMLYNKYVSECKPVHSGKETIEYQTVNGILTSAIIIVEDQDAGVIKTFLITKNEVTLLNSVPMGGMLYQMETSTFTCGGYDFYVQLVQPASDADFRSYLTISVYDKNGNLHATNINGLQVGSAVYTDIGNGTFDWVGNTKLKLSDCFSFDKDSITITRALYQWGSAQDEYTYSGDTTTYVYDAASKKFVEKGSSVQPTVLEIHENDSMTVTGTLSYEWDQINENNNYKHAILTLDTPITVKYMDGEWAGKTETIDSVQIVIEDELAEGTRLKVTGNVMYAHTGHHLRNIVLMDCSYEVLGKNDGKTDSGSTSKSSTNNTTGTPKTGDVATIPAVALGLTMTAAGVAAIIYKKRK